MSIRDAGVNSTSTPKGRLVDRSVDYLGEHGLSDVSLRELAAGIGTSHRMLLYHFGSKDGLLVEVAREVERRQQEAYLQLGGSFEGNPLEFARSFWRILRSPDLAPMERLFFELYGQALQGRPSVLSFLEGIVESWIERAVPGLVASGLDEDEARVEARLGVAVVRGLLLDVLATGDEAGVDAAFERYVATLDSARA